jgi:hypothetical protein
MANIVSGEDQDHDHDVTSYAQTNPATLGALEGVSRGFFGTRYEFVAPIDAKGHIDPELWRKYREHCRVRRFWNGESEQVGQLLHKPGGAEHARWVFDYDENRADDDEAGYRFGGHAFTPGEYVSITEDDGDVHTFRVVSVETAA